MRVRVRVRVRVSPGVVAHHLEEAEDERGLVLPRDGQVHVAAVRARVGDRGVAHPSERVGRPVHVLLDDRVLDVPG